MRILIIDDEPDVRDIAEACLSGHQVLSAASAEEGLRLAGRETPDLILLRESLIRGTHTEETLERFRSDRLAREIPIVLLADTSARAGLDGLLNSGVSGVVVTPIRPATFEREVIDAARGRSSDVPSSASGETLNAETVNALRELQTDDDPTFFSDLVGAFLTDVPLRLSRLRIAADRGQLDAVADEAHSLKSSSGNVGAEAMAKAASELEVTARKGLRGELGVRIRSLEHTFASTRQALVQLTDT